MNAKQKQKSIIMPTVANNSAPSTGSGNSRLNLEKLAKQTVGPSSRLPNVSGSSVSSISNISSLGVSGSGGGSRVYTGKKTNSNNNNIVNNKIINDNNNISKQSFLKGASARGNMMTMHMQQMGTIPLPTSSIVNAPTSLTNLAQMSGVTLLPMGTTSNKSKTTPRNQPITNNKNISSNNISTNFMLNNKNKKNFNLETTVPQQNSTSNNNININRASLPKRPVYDLANIPSVQLLNQTSLCLPNLNNSMSGNNNKNMERKYKNDINNMIFGNTNITKKNSQFNTTPNNRLNYNNSFSNNLKMSDTSMNSILSKQFNDIQVIPVTESMPLFGNYGDLSTRNTTSNNYQPQSSQNLMEDNNSDINGDMNNLSLMKLMAILNNPALTITAVNTSKNNNQYNNNSSSSSYGHSSYDLHQINTDSYETMPLSITTLSNNSKIKSSGNKQSEQSCSGLTTNNKNRAQQQIIHDSSTYHDETPYKSYSTSSLLKDTSINNCNNEYNDISDIQIINSSDQEPDWINEYKTFEKKKDVPLISKSSNKNNIFQADNNDKISDPAMLSTSVRNLMMQQLETNVSEQLLKHIANQSRDDDQTTSTQENNETKSTLDAECAISTLKVSRNIQPLKRGVMTLECSENVTTSCRDIKKKNKEPLITTRDRLYVPRSKDLRPSPKKIRVIDVTKIDLNSINIENGDKREVFLSEQHLILDSMMKKTSNESHQSAIPEPDEIFINRSKRVMSKIDTMIESKKRRRFERISSRADPKTNSLEDQCEESEEEWSDGDDHLQGVKFLKTQLPLNEIESEEKKNHLLSVGLVSRNEKNKLLINQLEKKVNIISPLLMENSNVVSSEIRRFVDMIVKTGGQDVQLTIESNIKKNDLPLIEGLNRNTSRMKMSYMNILGLEKRSKRTALYKVRPTESSSFGSSIINNNSKITFNKEEVDLVQVEGCNDKLKVDQLVEISKSLSTINNKFSSNGKLNSQIGSKLTLMNCREAIKPPSKNEYMKSLGLMAS